MEGARDVYPREDEILEEEKDKMKYVDQLIEEINEAFYEEIDEEGLEEHKVVLVQKLLELGDENYTFEDLRRDVEAFNLDLDSGGIEQSESALNMPNVTKIHKKRGRKSHKELQNRSATIEGQTKLIDIFDIGKGKILPKEV